MVAVTHFRLVHNIIPGFCCVIACAIIMSCTHKGLNSNTQKEVEAAFFEQRFNDVIGLLSPHTNELSASDKFYLAKSYLSVRQESKFTESISLLEDSARAGFSEAAWELARTYDEKTDMTNSTLVALDWYRYHALMTRNQINTIQYFDKHGKATSSSHMIEQMIELANKGDVETQVRLAKIYGEGINTEVDLPRSFFWYREAAESGNETAALMLGFYLCRGLGTDKDVSGANLWLAQYSDQLSCD